ncbi:phosphotriesterase-related protein [Algoriphagus ratkowskyi]|uniref:Phosphotriesterase n=1 Tax=Algoriphagus ratkowskyi TaxID=57028 RepID=A0A2W7RJT7_9BACT|nr:aryldialkylphosphatase [Algoriphagus ratkowskyi]PZX61103.1 phosphotriesterase-related protein [Algoriphagus ratkowskyi]TXD79233.1 phosphotriesterase [Algoriphagus ratkowskyi]
MKHILFLGLSFLLLGFSCSNPESQTTYINTVTGPIPIASMGITLIHEHMLVDFIGADSVSSERYNQEEVIAKVLPYLLEVKKYGVKTIFDCTPSYLAKDPVLLRKLSEQSGIHLVTNTGFYGEVGGKYLPDFAFTETAEELANRWIDEFENGIGATGIKPGFIKISVNEEKPLREIDAKLVKAAGFTHRETGLQIASHTGTWTTAKQEIKILQEMGIDASAFVWVHAQAEEDFQNYFEAAKLGVWISLDGIGWSVDEYVARLLFAKENGFLGQVLISHDAGWYDPAKPDGGDFQPFTNIFEKLMLALNAKGFDEADWEMFLEKNPKRAFGNEQ